MPARQRPLSVSLAFFSTFCCLPSTASSFRSLARAFSSDSLRLPSGAVGSLPFLAALARFAKVPFEVLIHFAGSSSVRPFERTSLTTFASMANGWIPERKARQTEGIRTWTPWGFAICPRTDDGKYQRSQSELVHGAHSGNAKLEQNRSADLLRECQALAGQQ